MKRIIKYIIELFFIVLIVFSSFMIIKWIMNTNNNKKMMKEINTKIHVEDIRDGKQEVDFSYLKGINSDTVGYIMVEGIDISYPVVQTSNNDYYLNHSFDKRKSSTGSIFMDYRNEDISDKNTIIYGHNMKDGSMFGKLKLLKNNSSLRTITYITEDSKYEYKIFSIYDVESEEYYISTNISNSKYLNFLKTLNERSIYNYDYEPKEEDRIITLSTCSYSNKRFVVHAYRVN